MTHNSTMIVTDNILNALIEKAKSSPRLRQHLTLHQGHDELSQRVVCAMEPGSYMQPHRHFSDPKQECFVGVRGKIALITFNDVGRINETYLLHSDSGVLIAQVEPDVWHTLVSLETGSVFFETKQGPYRPLTTTDIADWSPLPGSERAIEYMAELENAILLSH